MDAEAFNAWAGDHLEDVDIPPLDARLHPLEPTVARRGIPSPLGGASRPGGLWVSPSSDVTIDATTRPIRFVARAYPTRQGNHEIARVNFTVSWPGAGWTVACSTDHPVQTVEIVGADGVANVQSDGSGRDYGVSTSGETVTIATRRADLYSCLWTPGDGDSWPDLSRPLDSDLPATFNVYDREGNHNNAPHGSRIFRVTSRPDALEPTPTTYDPEPEGPADPNQP
jgi:hypothetical protein